MRKQKSNVYLPGEAFYCDSIYLPRDNHGYSKFLIICDAASNFTMIYPSKDLLVKTVVNHIYNLLCSHVSPKYIVSDFESEFGLKLSQKLAELNIAHPGGTPYNHNATGAVEMSAKLTKSTLSCIVLANPSAWNKFLL